MLLATQGCGLFSPVSNGSELVTAATDVGQPVGQPVKRTIGPSGGSVSTPDGRITLTIPKDSVAAPVEFSIQPITNKAEGGLGSGYRLEPNGQKFATPVEVTFKYDDKDLEGTAAEALTAAYQDEQKAWHLEDVTKLDQSAKTLTVLATHFTDWSFLARLRIFPETATVRVGKTLHLSFGHCYFHDNVFNRLMRFLTPGVDSCEVPDRDKNYWRIPLEWYADIGTLDNERNVLNVIYTAPPTKPNPNLATVSIPYSFGDYAAVARGMFTAHITIVDRGYRASGSDGPTTYSGTVCSLDKEFTVIGHNGPGYFSLKFTPSGDGRAGTGTLGSSPDLWIGGGSYTIDGFDSEKPRIVFVTQYSFNGKSGGAGTWHIDLMPLEGNECGGG